MKHFSSVHASCSVVQFRCRGTTKSFTFTSHILPWNTRTVNLWAHRTIRILTSWQQPRMSNLLSVKSSQNLPQNRQKFEMKLTMNVIYYHWSVSPQTRRWANWVQTNRTSQELTWDQAQFKRFSYILPHHRLARSQTNTGPNICKNKHTV